MGQTAAAEAAPAAAVGLDRSGVGLLELVLAAPSTEPTGLVDLLGWALLGLLGGSDVVGVEDLHVLDVGVVGAAGVDPGGGFVEGGEGSVEGAVGVVVGPVALGVGVVGDLDEDRSGAVFG